MPTPSTYRRSRTPAAWLQRALRPAHPIHHQLTRLPRRRDRDGRVARPDRGSVTLETAILFPIVLALTFGAIQVGLWYSARNMCQAAAEAGTRAGKVQHAPAGAGTAAARAYLDATAGGLVVDPNVSEGRTATTVTVSCTGRAQNVIPMPGFDISLAQSATAGIERFTTR